MIIHLYFKLISRKFSLSLANMQRTVHAVNEDHWNHYCRLKQRQMTQKTKWLLVSYLSFFPQPTRINVPDAPCSLCHGERWTSLQTSQ